MNHEPCFHQTLLFELFTKQTESFFEFDIMKLLHALLILSDIIVAQERPGILGMEDAEDVCREYSEKS